MADFALVLNAGSSSLKFCVYKQPETKDWQVEARGEISAIGTAPWFFVKDGQGKILAEQALDASISDGYKALGALVDWLRMHRNGSRLLGVGHRVVHGGTCYDHPVIVTREVLADLYRLVPFAPLHQPFNLAPIEQILDRLPEVPQVACFDTSFHRGHSAVVELVPLPNEVRCAELQRYGFHGLSYEYIASVLPQVAPEIANGRVIVAHLGNGASLCALKEGKSVDTSLGFTALDGLCMGTRPGSIDPGVVLFLFQNLGLSVSQVEDILYRKSGLLGISGITSDMRELLASSDPAALLAVDYFVFRAVKEIGAMAAVLGGIDGLVFTAGIGEHSAEIRRRICKGSAWLGLELDEDSNNSGKQKISSAASKVSVWVIPTNEELMIARHMAILLGHA